MPGGSPSETSAPRLDPARPEDLDAERSPKPAQDGAEGFDLGEAPDDHEHDESVLEVATSMVLDRLDPLEQQGGIDDPLTGKRMLPGIVPLAPLSIAAIILNTLSLLASMAFTLQYAPSYLLALSIFHAIVYGHLWTYYVGYRTRKWFLALRQMLFILILVAFVDWMLLDMMEHPPSSAQARARLGDTYETYIWAGIVLNGLVAAVIFAHWAVLGRGYHEAPPLRDEPPDAEPNADAASARETST